MNKTTILTHIANFAEAIALVARELASTPEQAASPAAPPVVEQPAPKKRGPKPKAEPQITPEREKEKLLSAPNVHSEPEFKPREGLPNPLPNGLDATSELTRDDLRLLFEPVVKRGDGPKVKEALKKYGVEKLADLEAKDFDLFGRDIDDLLTPNEQAEFIAAGHPYFPK